MAINDKKRNWLIGLALALGTIALYSPVIRFDFVNFDDPRYVVSNYHINPGWSWKGLIWCFQAGYAANWHPLTWMTHMLDCQLFGLWPGGPHAVNVLLHAANSTLLFLILVRLTGATCRSAMVAALFAWHPLHVESVAWVSERKDVLSTLFWMLTILAYLNYVRKRGSVRYFLVLLIFALGLMAKQMLVTLPFVLLLLDWWPLGRLQKTPESKPWLVFAEKLPFFPFIIASSILTIIAQTRGGAVSSLAGIPWLTRLLTVDVSYYRYLVKLFWPTKMAIIYPYEYWFARREVIAGAVVLVFFSAAAIAARKTRPYLLLGWLWYLGTLVPVIGIIQIGAQSMADRYSYIPSIGLFLIVVWGTSDLMQNWKHQKAILAMLGAGAALACALATSVQLGYWYDGGTIFSHSIAVTADNFIAHSSYSAYLRDHDRLKEAQIQAEASVHIAPDYAVGHNFLGEILMKQGKTDEAVKHLRKAIDLHFNQADPYRDLGNISMEKGEPKAAEVEFKKAAQIDPSDPTVHCLLGMALSSEGNLAGAEKAYTEAIRLAPTYAEAHNNLGATLAAEDKIPESIRHYHEAIKYIPNYPEALNNLAWILSANSHPEYRNGAEAVTLASRACELTRNQQPVLIGTLGAAYAETGKFTEAEAMAKKAGEMALAAGDKALAAKNEELMALYRSHQAYHETNNPPTRDKPAPKNR